MELEVGLVMGPLARGKIWAFSGILQPTPAPQLRLSTIRLDPWLFDHVGQVCPGKTEKALQKGQLSTCLRLVPESPVGWEGRGHGKCPGGSTVQWVAPRAPVQTHSSMTMLPQNSQ